MRRKFPRLLYRLAVLALAGLLCLNARAQDCPSPFQPPTQAEMARLVREAQDRGFLWRIEKDGVTSYLYGTLHAQKLDWYGIGPRLRQALQAANALALELDPTDPEVRRQLSAPPAKAIPRFTLSEPLRERLRARMKAECVDPAALRAQAPQLQLTMLGLLDARRDGLEAALGSDVMLAGAARMEGKPIHSLETVPEQLSTLQPATQSELADTVEQGLNDLDNGLARRVLVRLANAWSASHADDLLHYQDWCECLKTDVERAQLKRLLDDRNPRLAARIDALHAQQGPLLVGVGALHMFGATGLPALLQARGFKVTRVF